MSPNVYWPCRTSFFFLLALSHFGKFLLAVLLLASSPALQLGIRDLWANLQFGLTRLKTALSKYMGKNSPYMQYHCRTLPVTNISLFTLTHTDTCYEYLSFTSTARCFSRRVALPHKDGHVFLTRIFLRNHAEMSRALSLWSLMKHNRQEIQPTGRLAANTS